MNNSDTDKMGAVPLDTCTDLNILRTNPMKRRAFLSRMTAAGLGVAATSLLGSSLLTGCGGGGGGGGGGLTGTGGVLDPANFPGISGRNINEVVLNFALTLELLEADLYRQALNKASGKALTTPLAADPSSYTLAVSGAGVRDSAASFKYLRDFAYVEAAHRDFLTTQIRAGGGTPATAPAAGYTFPTPLGASLGAILTQILPLEETGVRAYLGAAGFLTDLGLATVAVGIYSTEARHSAVVSVQLSQDAGPTPMAGDQKVTGTYPHPNTFEYFLTPPTVLNAVKPFFVS